MHLCFRAAACAASGVGAVRKVGLPPTVFTIAFRVPPRSNSWAEIFRTGVTEPEVTLEPDVGDRSGLCHRKPHQPQMDVWSWMA